MPYIVRNRSPPHAQIVSALKTITRFVQGNRPPCLAKLYTKAEVHAFCRWRRPDGSPLHWGHISYLLSVRDKAERRRWERLAAENGWSAHDLRAQMRRKGDNPAAHGRQIKPPANIGLGLIQLIHEGKRWKACCQTILTMPGRGRVPAKLLQEAAETFAEIAATAKKAAKRLGGAASAK